MNIKKIILGSTVMLATGSAYGADAVVVAEPEPTEYVKICDIYGAGYFYIPGTETCLRIGGYIRYDASFGDAGRALDGADATDRLDGSINDTWAKNARFNLKTWTGQETEFGTLKTYTETRFNFGNTAKSGIFSSDPSVPVGAYNKPVTLNFAWVQLGGLRVGKDETAFTTFTGYAGSVIQDAIVPFGSYDTNAIQYYFDAGNGLTAVASLEQGAGATDTIDSYVPHVVGGVKYKGDWGSVTAVAAYNSVWEEWAGKVRLDVKPSTDFSLFLMAAYGTDDNVSKNFYKLWNGNFAVWGGGSYFINKKVSLNTQVSYTDAQDFAVAANVSYSIVPGYTITAEVDYYDNFDIKDADSIGGIVRFQRSF